MILNLDKITLFKEEPSVRFGREFGVKVLVWNNLWYRYKILGYNTAELQEYFEFKYKRKIGRKSLNRWITRMEIFLMSQNLRRDGIDVIDIEYFNGYKNFIERSLHIK